MMAAHIKELDAQRQKYGFIPRMAHGVMGALNSVTAAQPKDPFREMQQVLYQASLSGAAPLTAVTEVTPEVTAYEAKYGLEMSVEKLQALEEMEAGLDDDPDFADDAVGAGRVRQRVVYVQQGGAAPPQQVGSAAPPPPASAAASAAGMAANIDISTNFAQIKDVTARLGRVSDRASHARAAP